jgi:hypothetical protein
LATTVLLAVVVLGASPGRAQALVLLTGSYAGTGSSQTISKLRFTPNFVMVRQSTDTTPAVVKTTSMAGSASKAMEGRALLPNQNITSLQSSGFTVGNNNRVNNNRVNNNGSTYHWVAIRSQAGQMAEGSYFGTGGTSRTVTVGFQPSVVIVMSDGNDNPVFRTASMTGTASHFFDSTAVATDAITALNTTGLQVGLGGGTNTNGRTYYWVAFATTSGVIQEGTYTGDDVQGRVIVDDPVTPFQPEFALVKGAGAAGTTRFSLFHTGSLGYAAGTESLPVNQRSAAVSGGITALPSNGFTVCSTSPCDNRVNATGETCCWFALQSTPPTAATVRSVAAEVVAGLGGAPIVAVRWTTDAEIDNLGFHVWRQRNGRRQRVTRELVAGGAPRAHRSSLANGASYLWYDRSGEGAGADGSVYWVEAVGLDGRTELFGPALPNSARSLLLPPPSPSVADAHHPLELSAAWGLVTTRASGAAASVARALARPSLTSCALASRAVVQVGVERPGWLRVGQGQLVAAGLPASVDPRRLQVFVDGAQLPIRVLGEEDGRLDPQDSVELLGELLDTRWTGTRVYWVVEGERAGLRLAAHQAPAVDAARRERTVELHDRALYVASLRNGDGDNFVGAVVAGGRVEQPMVLECVDQTSCRAASVELAVQGLSAGVHTLRVELNGASLGTLELRDQALATRLFSVSAGRLVTGRNVLTLTPLGGAANVSAISSVRIHYPYAGTASEADLVGAAAFVRRVTPPRWCGGDHAADVLMIAPAALLPAVEPLAGLREGQGWRVARVSVEEIYDATGYGAKGPEALRSFIHTASTTWRVRPRFVLLLGDASFDPRGFLGQGRWDKVPTQLVDTQLLETASDDWFVDFNDDGVPDLAIGRLPARSADEARALVDKVVRYETAAGSRDGAAWRRRALLLSDRDASFDFAAAQQEARSAVAGLSVEQLVRGAGTGASEVLARLNAGAFLVSYFGHGSAGSWLGTLTGEAAGTLSNVEALPIVASMTCLNGFFHDVYSERLAESLLPKRPWRRDRRLGVFVAPRTRTAVHPRPCVPGAGAASVRRRGGGSCQGQRRGS